MALADGDGRKQYDSIEDMIRAIHKDGAPELLLDMERLKSAKLQELCEALARRLTIKGDAAFVAAEYVEACLAVPELVQRDASGANKELSK